jgi:ADP-ribosyl-[dinitrogen reductase] hydrolase
MRHVGSLVALAIGDALGAPFEGSPQPEAWVTEMRSGGRHFRKKGEITDDTLQAIAVAESLAICRGFDPGDLVKRLPAGYKSRPAWFGPTSSAFFDLVESGTLPHQAAWLVHKRRGGSRSNGSVMRGFPLGIFYSGPEVYRVSMACSQLTHYDPVGGHCSAFLNTMVSDMCRGIPRTTAFRHAWSLCTDPEVRTVLGNYRDYPLVPGLDAVECSHAALSCFMESRSLEHAILRATNLGGDTDTVGACTGALAGAYWGIDAVPLRWCREVEGYDRMVQLAERVWGARADRPGRPLK